MPRRLLLPLFLPTLGLADIVVDQFGYRTDAAKIAMPGIPPSVSIRPSATLLDHVGASWIPSQGTLS